jgi:hypothetical protein
MLGENSHPKVVAEMLGHRRIRTTLDLYNHPRRRCRVRLRRRSMPC